MNKGVSKEVSVSESVQCVSVYDRVSEQRNMSLNN